MSFSILFLFVTLTAVNGLAVEKEVQQLTGIKPIADDMWCDAILGCLEIGGDWNSPGRPINVAPYDREKIGTTFLLHTREHNPPKGEDVELDADNLITVSESTFDPTKPIILITHGFIDTGYKSWLYDFADDFLNFGDYNVIRVDWGGGSLPMYYQASANIRVVGLEIGHLVNKLISTYGADPASVHCLGHSLGSHVCGYAGEQISGMGRITGLDPAGPYFTGTASFVHLDPTDAIFVDVIHTDADSIFLLGYGTAQPFGNVDFYPNSGHDQPRCDPVSVAVDSITEEMVGTGRDLACCSHLRAITYFQESLRSSNCNWQAHECYNYDSFEEGNCGTCATDNSKCAYMGINADQYVSKDRIYGLFFLDTDGYEPYCIEHYQISILLAEADKDNGAESWVMGRLFVTLYGEAGTIEQRQITSNHERIDHGTIHRTMMIDSASIGTILRVELKWAYDDNVFNPGTWCWSWSFCNRKLYVDSVEVSPINYYPETTRVAMTTLTCAQDGSTTQIKDGDTESFVEMTVCESLDGH